MTVIPAEGEHKPAPVPEPNSIPNSIPTPWTGPTLTSKPFFESAFIILELPTVRIRTDFILTRFPLTKEKNIITDEAKFNLIINVLYNKDDLNKIKDFLLTLEIITKYFNQLFIIKSKMVLGSQS